jgi:hypothetical protein
MTKTFADFSVQLLELKQRLRGNTSIKKEIANVAGDGAVSMPPTAVNTKKKRKSMVFSVTPKVYDAFRRGKTKFERWIKYLDLNDESQKPIYDFARKNPKGIIVIKNSVTGEVRAIRYNRHGSGNWHKISKFVKNEIVNEVPVSKSVEDDAEKNVKDLKKNTADFKKRYGERWKDVMYATAMKMAKKQHGIGEDKTYGGILQDIKSSIQNINTKPMDDQFETVSYKVPDPMNEDAMATLKKIVQDKSYQNVKFEKGNMKVDLTTASAILQVYNALKKPEIKKKLERMVNYSPQSLRTVANFAFGKIK